MRRTSAVGGIGLYAALGWLVAASASGQPARPANPTRPLCSARMSGTSATPSSDAVAIADLRWRLDEYVALKRQVQAGIRPLHVTADAAAIRQSVDQLTTALRMARAGARQGDIVPPPVAGYLRAQIATAIDGEDVEKVIAALGEDEEQSLVSRTRCPAVNMRYPGSGPVATIPPAILRALPRLPPDLSYGFIGTTLILWDMDAGVIVDVVPDALSAAAGRTR